MAQFITYIELYMLQINRFAKDELRVIFLEVFNLGILKCLYVVGDTGLEPVTFAIICKRRRCSLFLITELITQIGFYNNY